MINFNDLPQSIKDRLVSRAANHVGTTAVEMYEAIPLRLRDNPVEIQEWLNSHQWSHITPKTNGGTSAVWETNEGFPNQVRGDQNMTLEELQEILRQNEQKSQHIDDMYSNDVTLESFDESAGAAQIPWGTSLEQAFIGIGMTGAAGYAIAFTFRIGRNIFKHRDQLVKSRAFRKSFLIHTLKEANRQGIRGASLAFLIAFICAALPAFKYLVITGALVGLARLGVELLSSVVNHVDPSRKSILSKAFDFSIKALNFAAMVFAKVWAILNVAVDWIEEGLRFIGTNIKKIAGIIFNAVADFMDWLLGKQSIVVVY